AAAASPPPASPRSATACPAPLTAGTAGGFAASAQDAYGNVATGYAGTVHFSSSDIQAVLPADATLNNGTAAFSATFKTAGMQSLTASDTVATSVNIGRAACTDKPSAAGRWSASAFRSPR